MKIKNHAKLTIIMRNYTREQADLITRIVKDYGDKVAIEITLNTENALQIISTLIDRYGKDINIGAGTIRTISDLKSAHEVGAKFILGPHMFTKEMLKYCKDNDIVSVPSAMTPSEINKMFHLGADIVKVFPATVVGSNFFKNINQAFGEVELMAVGGININNVKEFVDNGASYVGLGSGAFSKNDLVSLNETALRKSLVNLINQVYCGEI